MLRTNSHYPGQTINTLIQTLAVRPPAVPEPDAPATETAAPRAPSPKTMSAIGEKTPMANTVRISTDKLDSIFLQAEEMLAAKLLGQQRRQELAAMQTMAANWHRWIRRLGPEQQDLQHTAQVFNRCRGIESEQRGEYHP